MGLCKFCKKTILDGAKFCKFCGAVQNAPPNIQICPNPNCKSESPLGASFCKKCGTKFTGQFAASRSQAQVEASEHGRPPAKRGPLFWALCAVGGVLVAGGAYTSVNALKHEKSASAVDEPAAITLATGTTFRVAASSTISTKTAKAGDVFEAALCEDIFEGGRVIAKKDSIVKGVVINSDPGGPIDGPAKLTMQITQLTLADGQTVSVKTNVHTATGKISKDSAAIGIEAALRSSRAMSDGQGTGGVDIGALEKAQSTPAVVAKGTPIAFRLTEDLTFTLGN